MTNPAVTGLRVPPLPVDQWEPGLLERTTEILGGAYRSSANVYCTMARNPKLFEAWLSFGAHLLRRSSLDERDRELVILRTTAMCGGSYPFAQHTRIGLESGLSPADIEAILVGRGSQRWASIDRLLLSAVDELLLSGTLSDGVWAELNDNISTHQTIDLIATVSFYRMASWMLNLCGTELDTGQSTTLRRPDPITAAARPQTPGVRLPPRPLNEWPEDLLVNTATWPRFQGRPEIRAASVYGTLAQHPDLFEAIGPFMAHLLVDNSLTDRHREIVIVRSCLRDRGEYPYRQHVRIAAEAGVSESDLAHIASPSPEMTETDDGPLVELIDQLHTCNQVDDDLWHRLKTSFSQDQILDAVATAGFYGLISLLLNSTGAALEEGTVVLPDLIPPKELP